MGGFPLHGHRFLYGVIRSPYGSFLIVQLFNCRFRAYLGPQLAQYINISGGHSSSAHFIHVIHCASRNYTWKAGIWWGIKVWGKSLPVSWNKINVMRSQLLHK